MGRWVGADGAGAIAVLRRLSENSGAVRRFYRGLPVALHKRERAKESRRVWYGDAVDPVRAQALRAYRGPSWGCGFAGASWHEESPQRGLGTARLRGDRRRRGRGMAASPSWLLHGAASLRAVDS